MGRVVSRFVKIVLTVVPLCLSCSARLLADNITVNGQSSYALRNEQFSPDNSNDWWPFWVYSNYFQYWYLPAGPESSPNLLIRNSTYSFNQFDPSLGTLTAVRANYASSIDMDYWAGPAAVSARGQFYFAINQAFTGPGGVFLANAPAAAGQSKYGIVDVGGGGPYVTLQYSNVTAGSQQLDFSSSASNFVGSGAVQLGVVTSGEFHADTAYFDGGYNVPALSELFLSSQGQSHEALNQVLEFSWE
jgi:hypothetical protein